MLRFIKEASFWTFVVVSLIYVYGQICDWFFTQPKYLDAENNKRAWNLVHRDQQFDLAVLGNSRAYGVFDMKELSARTGKSCINLGAPGSGFVDNYLTLALLLKNGNSIKEIFLQVDLYSLNSKMTLFEPFHKYHFVQYWKDKDVRNTILDYSSNREVRLLTIFPEARYIKFNKYFSPKELLRRATRRSQGRYPFDATLGGRIQYPEKEITDVNGERLNATPFKFTFDKKDVEYLQKILFLCRSRNIRVTAFRAPEYQPWMKPVLNYDEAYREIEEMLSKENIRYIWEILPMESNPTFFYDGTHLNRNGVVPFTIQFLEKMKK